MTRYYAPPVSNVRGWMALIGSTILGFGIGDMIHIGATYGVDEVAFVVLAVVAGFGLGLVLAGFLWRPQTILLHPPEEPSAPSSSREDHVTN
jgi:hypothetical protein